MTVVETINALTAWADANICEGVKLKKRPDGGKDFPTSGDAPVELVKPASWPLFVPTAERKSPRGTAPTIPSLCVEIMPPAKDDPQRTTRTMTVRLSLAAWNPGVQEVDGPIDAKGFTEPDAPNGDAPAYEPTMDGWKDVFNFLDAALRAVETTDRIGDELRILHEEGFEWGPFEDPDFREPVNLYPYWFAWVSFKVEAALLRSRPNLDGLL
jgi:hypothetical protein